MRPTAALVVLIALTPVPGCQVPSYRLPAGFSSTYHRALYGPRPDYPAVSTAEPGSAQSGLFSGYRTPLKIASDPAREPDPH